MANDNIKAGDRVELVGARFPSDRGTVVDFVKRGKYILKVCLDGTELDLEVLPSQLCKAEDGRR